VVALRLEEKASCAIRLLAELRLDVSLESDWLRFVDPVTGQRFLTHQETEQARRAAEERAAQETALRQAAEARVAELEARLQAMLAAGAEPPAPPADA
jgi:hypothetical protein